MKKAILFIPARIGSKRLLKKNIQEVWGKPMIEWVIKEALEAELVSEVIVGSDSEEVIKIALDAGANTVKRGRHYCTDNVSKIDAGKEMSIKWGISQDVPIVLAQANSPEVDFETINEMVTVLNSTDRKEVITTWKGNQHGALRAVKDYSQLWTPHLSYKLAYLERDWVDIHTEEDLNEVEGTRKAAHLRRDSSSASGVTTGCSEAN